MAQLIARIYHYLTDDVSGELEITDGAVWLKTHQEEI